jgi:hypothetical protein
MNATKVQSVCRYCGRKLTRDGECPTLSSLTADCVCPPRDGEPACITHRDGVGDGPDRED